MNESVFFKNEIKIREKQEEAENGGRRTTRNGNGGLFVGQSEGGDE